MYRTADPLPEILPDLLGLSCRPLRGGRELLVGRETTSKRAFGMLWVVVCIRVQVHVRVWCVTMASLCMPQGAPSQLMHLPLPLQTGRTATPLSAPDWCHSWSPGIDDCGRWKIPRQRSTRCNHSIHHGGFPSSPETVPISHMLPDPTRQIADGCFVHTTAWIYCFSSAGSPHHQLGWAWCLRGC